MSGVPVTYDHIRTQGRQYGLDARLMAVVAEGTRGRVYLSPITEHEEVARDVVVAWKPDMPLPNNPRDFKTPNYGLPTFADLFTSRQLVSLTAFSDLVGEATERVRRDAVGAGLPDDGRPLRDGGTGATAYAEAVALYLGCGIGRAADYWNSNATWQYGGEFVAHAFTRQAVPMVWDFAESNPLSEGSGNWQTTCIDWIERVVARLPGNSQGSVQLAEGQTQTISAGKMVSTDPPYYDNIGYADLSDFFYVWLRRSLKPVFPNIFTTLAVPKAEELVATPYRHGGREAAESFFLNGMTKAIRRLAEQSHPGFPVTIYYAFKQSERKGDAGVASTGWETFLDAVIWSGFAISGTWPIRTERVARSTGIGTNALASSIVLVCRRRPRRRSGGHAQGVSDCAPLGAATGAAPDAIRQRGTSRSRASSHRPRHGSLYPLREGTRRFGEPRFGARGIGAHQPDPR